MSARCSRSSRQRVQRQLLLQSLALLLLGIAVVLLAVTK